MNKTISSYLVRDFIARQYTKKQVLELMQMDPKEIFRRAILTATWFNV